MNSALRYILLLVLPLYAADQVTKALILRNVSSYDAIPVVPGFLNLVQVHNTGAAFGMLKDSNLFFIVLACVALVVIAALASRGAFVGLPMRVAASLLAAGIIGNLTDRILHGFVVDFLDVILPWYGRWPAFNVADSCICIAAGLFIWQGFLPETKPVNNLV